MKSSDRFLNSIESFIESEKLMTKNGKYLVALSGGADSVALLVSLHLLGYKIEAVHCNFKLRDKESDRDENFCMDFCKRFEIKLHITHFNTYEYAVLKKISIEMAARELRYSYFQDLCNDISAYGICIGHHIEDSVETLLINLIRGTGINGLTGISPKNGLILRPLLCVTRKEIEKFLDSLNLNYVNDSTNFVDDVVRNKIRLNIMPMIRDINPSADVNISKTAKRLAEANKVFEEAIGQSVNIVMHKNENFDFIDINKLLSQTSPEYTLFSILSRYGFSPQQVEDISTKIVSIQTGSIFNSSTHRILFDRNYIIISDKSRHQSNRVFLVPKEGLYTFGRHKFKMTKFATGGTLKIEKSRDIAYLDYNKLKFPLHIRRTKRGDRFVPFGMQGCKLVSDYLTDRKVSMFDKETMTVLTDRDDNIVWLIGQRIDNRFRITEYTEIVFKVSMTSG